jgi:hypothetical protein
VKIKINLMQDEIISLSKIALFSTSKSHIFLQSLFGGESFILVSHLFDEEAWPTTLNNKIVR